MTPTLQNIVTALSAAFLNRIVYSLQHSSGVPTIQMAESPTSRQSSYNDALVSRIVTPPDRHRDPQPGWCEERRDSGFCGCYKALFSQQCQSCGQYIRKGHCIYKESCGWVHRFCPGDEKRGSLAISQGLNPNVRYDALLTNESFTIASHQTSRRDVEKLTSARRKLDFDGADGGKKRLPSKILRLDDTRPGSEDSFRTTQEQDAILAHVPVRGEPPVCINALAGCGKTTTIAMLCKKLHDQHPDWKLLYIVFGRKNQEEAKDSKKFPKRNMEIRTSHAFVLRRYFGTEGMNSVNPVDEYDLDDILRTCNVLQGMKRLFPNEDHASKRFKQKMFYVGSHIRTTVRNFQASLDLVVAERHVSWRCNASTNLSSRTAWRRMVPPDAYVGWARTFFNAVQDRCNRVRDGKSIDRGISHDGYVKVAQLEVDLTDGYDVIIVDEAQDLTPCQADIFWGALNREDRMIYLFGDRHQQLYRFRGAGTSFQGTCEASDTTSKFDLTGSFRFGENIASVATTVLMVLGGKRLVGRALCPGRTTLHHGDFKQGVVLTRTNNGMYEYLLDHRPRKWCYLDGRNKAFPKVPSFVLALEEFLKTDIERGESCEDEGGDRTFQYKGEVFNSIDDIHDYVDDEGDTELMKFLHLLQFLQEEQTCLKDFVASIQDSFCPLGSASPDNYMGCILGTVHKAKGLEFDNVLIYDDFNFESLYSTVSSYRMNDEAHTLYVAVTRAKEHLCLCRKAHDCLKQISRTMSGPTLDIRTSMSLDDVRLVWEERWRVFSSTMPVIQQLSDIPLPSSACDHELAENCLALDSNMDEQSQRRYIRSIQLRYHPDKFFSKFGHLIDDDEPTLLLEIKDTLTWLMQTSQDALRELQDPDEVS